MTFSCPPHLTNVSTLPGKTYRTSFVAIHYIFPYRLWTFGIKFSLTVETKVFNSQQLFPSCLLIYIIDSLPVLLISLLPWLFSVFFDSFSHMQPL